MIILITEPEYRKAAAVFDDARSAGFDCRPAPPEEMALAAAIHAAGAGNVILGVERYAGPLYDTLPRGGVIARFGVGCDGVDLARATVRGILCTNTPGALDRSVAEHTLALLLAAARRLPRLSADCAAGRWAPALGAELHGRRLAVVGLGPIGGAVARIAAFGFGMRVSACEVRPVDAESARRDFGVERLTPDWAEAVRGADFVSLHIPSHPATRHFVNAGRLAALAPGAWLINTARGAVVDEAALYDALAAGRLAGAALDVFEREPYVPIAPGRDLRTRPNTILTPHVGSSTAEACERMARHCLRNLAAARAGDSASMSLLNPEVLKS